MLMYSDVILLWGMQGWRVVRALASHHCGPASIPGPSIIWGLSLLLVLVLAPRVFLRLLWFSSLHKNQHSKFQFDPEMRATGYFINCYYGRISNTHEKGIYRCFVLIIITCIVSSSAASLSFCSFSLVLSKVTSSKPNSSFLATCIFKQKKTSRITILIVCKNDSCYVNIVNIQAYSYKHNMVSRKSHLKMLSHGKIFLTTYKITFLEIMHVVY